MMGSEEGASEIGRIMGQAVAEQTRRYTYCLINNGDKVGSAVAIKLGNRFFFATAAHVIEHSNDIKALVRGQTVLNLSDFVAKHCDDCCDVGLLEISASNSSSFDFLPKDCISKTINGEQELPAMVVGFPGQFYQQGNRIDLTGGNQLQIDYFNTLSFHTSLIPQSKWPSEGLPDAHGQCQQLVADRDMLIDYEPESKVTPITPRTTATKNPSIGCPSINPCGMSGGGIWLAQITNSRGGLTIPDARLIGIQISWYQKSNLLRGIRVGAWLDLIRDRYPDLSDVV